MAIKFNDSTFNGNGIGIFSAGKQDIELTNCEVKNNITDGIVLDERSDLTLDKVKVENNGGHGIKITNMSREINFESTSNVLEFFGLSENKCSKHDLIMALKDVKESLEKATSTEEFSKSPSLEVFKRGTLDSTTIVANLVTISPAINKVIEFLSQLAS